MAFTGFHPIFFLPKKHPIIQESVKVHWFLAIKLKNFQWHFATCSLNDCALSFYVPCIDLTLWEFSFKEEIKSVFDEFASFSGIVFLINGKFQCN